MAVDRFHCAFQMHQVRAKDLQTATEFFDLCVDFFFYVGSFVDLVSDMNVHESLESGLQFP